MLQSWKVVRCKSEFFTGLRAVVAIASFLTAPATFAQITPDTTLGTEPSTVNPNGSIRGLPGVLLEGGARRGVNLFQSFATFNVGNGQRVYFANPSGVQNILSRVTGGSASGILGTLGVDGAANLFLLNPNGILFGANARLDVAGSFVASTASRLDFGNGLSFSATQPEAAPMMTVSLRPGLQYGTDYRGDVTNAGSLAVGAGQMLTLAGHQVTSTGSLIAPGGTVQLLGRAIALQDTAQIDVSGIGGGGMVQIGGDYQGGGTLPTASQTFVGRDVAIAADALGTGNGGRVIVWSNEATQFYGSISARGGDLSGNGGFVEVSGLRSLDYNGQVNAGAANGTPGTLLLDPTNIEVVASGGTATLADVALASTPDLSFGVTRINASVINAANQNVSLQATNNITFNAPILMTQAGIGLNALAGNGITVNQFIGTFGGDVTLTAQRGDVTLNGTTIDTEDLTGTAGDISLIAGNQVRLLSGSSLNARSDTAAGTSDFATITLRGNGVSLNNTTISTTNNGTGLAGDIFIDGRDRIDILNNSRLFSRGDFGRILLGVSNGADFNNLQTTPLPTTIQIRNSLLSTENTGTTNRGAIGVFARSQVAIAGSQLLSEANNSNTNDFSRIRVIAREGTVSVDSSRISATNDGTGLAGDVIINANVQVNLSNNNGSNSAGDDLGIFSRGGLGRIFITSDNGSVAINNTFVSTTNFQSSRSGDVVITAQNQLGITNSSIFSRGNQGRVLLGQSNDLESSYPTFSPATIRISNSDLNTNNGSVAAGGIDAGGVLLRATGGITVESGTRVSSSSDRQGNAGDVILQTGGNVNLNSSDIQSNLEAGGIGASGNVLITANAVFLNSTPNARLAAQIQTLVRGPDSDTGQPGGQGNAGDVIILASQTTRVLGTSADGFPSAIFSTVNEGATGDSGNVVIGTRTLHIRNGGRVNVDNRSTAGLAGNVVIGALALWLDNDGQITGESFSGQGGNILMNVPGAVILGRNSNISTTAGSVGAGGNGGNIAIGSGTVNPVFLIRAGISFSAFEFDGRTLIVAGQTRRDNNILAQAFAGIGGNIRVNAFRLQDIAERPDLPTRNDISTASAFGIDGTTVISTLNIFPSLKVTPLPERYAPPRITQGCDPRDRQESSQFVITGRGGLPTNPTTVLNQDTLALSTNAPLLTPQLPRSPEPTAIVPARGWIVDANGDAVLTAQARDITVPASLAPFGLPLPGCPAPIR